MKADPVAELLLNYLCDVIHSASECSAALNIDELPEGFRELGKGLLYFAGCITETKALANDMSRGILTNELPPRENEIAAPLKSLHASLKHLTWQSEQITNGDYNQRVGFMGEFSASFNKMIEQLAERDTLLKTVNHVAAALLSANDEIPFENLLAESMEFLGKCVDADRVHIWRSGMIDDNQVLFHSYEWNNKNATITTQINLNYYIPYDTFPLWENIINRGEIIHGSFSSLPREAQTFFEKYRLKSIVVIPLFLNDKFWGIFSLDSCTKEQTFSEEEIHILQSAGLMMINAIQRNEAVCRTEKLAHWYHSILDAIPLPISVTDTEMKWTFINMAVENFLGITRKDMLGRHCSNWGAQICNTEECGIACVKRGKKQTFFSQNNSSFNVDVEILKDLNGDTAGYIEIVQNVTKIETMAKKQAEAEAASNAKSAFLANMSHEIRTPMNAILGISEIQLRNEYLPHQTGEAFQKIYEAGNLLLNIINDILDLSKIEAGKLELVTAIYDVPTLINDTTQLNRIRYESKPVDFYIHLDENTPHYLHGDELRIKQILNNILSNAFKYTGEGTVSLTISSREDINDSDNVTLVLRVRDTGQGMTENQVERIFDEYSRFNIEANRSISGTGLGMSITKRLIDLMNGQITVSSVPGEGSEFMVRIPQKRAGQEICGRETADKLRRFNYQNTSIKHKSQFKHEYMPYGSVLVVDDVESNIYVIKGMLLPYGLKIDTASSGFEAVKRINDGNVYDIVFMDHMMPKMNGIETTKKIRGMGYSHTIVALTANALIGRAEMFLKNGFDGFISKPIDSRELNHMLNKYIRNKQPPEVLKSARQKTMRNAISPRNEVSPRSIASPLTDAQKVSTNEKLAVAVTHDIESTLAVLEDLMPKINTKDLELYITTVHGIKSGLANIGETSLSDTARRLEDAAQQAAAGNGETSVLSTETAEFMGNLRLFTEKLKKHETNETENPGPEDMVFLRDKLNVIKTGCEKFVIKDAKTALGELKRRTWPREIDNILNEISLYLIQGEFPKVAAAVDIASIIFSKYSIK